MHSDKKSLGPGAGGGGGERGFVFGTTFFIRVSKEGKYDNGLEDFSRLSLRTENGLICSSFNPFPYLPSVTLSSRQ